MEEFKYDKEYFIKIVKSSNNLTDIARNLGIKPFCGNRNTIKKYIQIYNIDISHFKIDYINRKVNKRPIDSILMSGTIFNVTNLKKRLYNEGLKERKCELCGQDENWQGKHMSLILDHINGINNDNRIENLRIVCPNCDATLPTFSGRNVKTKYNVVLKKEIVIKYCECGKKIDNYSKKCVECNSIKQRKKERPSYDELKLEINNLGYSATGRKYGVSDNTIRKWIKYYEKLTRS